MGVMRKITSLSTLGLVDFQTDQQRSARSARLTKSAVRKGNRQAGAAALIAQQQQAQMIAWQADQARLAAWHAEQTRLQIATQQAAQEPRPTAAGAVVEQLRDLARLRDEGVIDEAEFARLKSQVIDG